MSGTKLFLLLVISALISGCGQEKKTIASGYELERFESGKYYLRTRGDTSLGGTFDGTIEQIGWNKSFILARVNRLYQGDSNGWYLLDLRTRVVRGPISESELTTNAAISTIRAHECESLLEGR